MGATFGMSMHLGINYSMLNEVIEFDDGKRIAWQTRPSGSFQGKFFGGRIWRYELEPADGGTLVRESWDISQEKGPIKGAARHREIEGSHPRRDGEDARQHRAAHGALRIVHPCRTGPVMWPPWPNDADPAFSPRPVGTWGRRAMIRA